MNGKALDSEWTDLMHGVNLELSYLRLSVHIHYGFNSTCEGCEPSLVEAFFEKQKLLNGQNTLEDKVIASKSIEEQRRITNRLLKEAMGINVSTHIGL